MKIGIIIYSQTGNTKKVAGKLQEKLSSAGHDASIEEITIDGKIPAQPGKFELANIPAVEIYDAVIFGAPVQAFSLNPVMKVYMKKQKLQSLAGKKAAIFVTKQIPLFWVGGTGAVGIMKKACESGGAEVLGTEIVVWAKKKREQTIKRCVDNISNLF